jgi:type IV pilus assembly protein PilC
MATIVSRIAVGPGERQARPPAQAWRARVLERLRRRRTGPRVGRRDTIQLLEDLADLLEGGLQLAAAVHTIQNATTSRAVRQACAEITAHLEHGLSLGAAFEHLRFPAAAAAAVRAGEESAQLVDVLRSLVARFRRQAEARSEVLRAMAYPAFVLTVLSGVVALFLLYVLPRVEPLLGEQKPLATQLLIGLARVVGTGWPGLLAVGVAGAWLLRRLYRTPYRFRMPVFGGLFRAMALERSFGHLGMLVRSGVDLTRAITVTADSLADPVVASRWHEVLKRLRRGATLAAALAADPILGGRTSPLIAVGEEAGILDRQLEKIDKLMRTTVERQLRFLVSLVGPVTLGLAAGFILMVFFGLFLPIYSNMSALTLQQR